MPPKNVIVIVGTTGVGKSQFSIELAKRYNGEIINADSMQMYRDIPVITNKHPLDEREGIPHHVMNHTNWDEEYFIHRFEKEAREKIQEIHERGKIPIVVGGTHYYLNSLLLKDKTIKTNENMEEEQDSATRLTEQQKQILNGSPDLVYDTLAKEDPKIAGKFHPNDTRRVKRALEIIYLTNKKTSDHYSSQQEVSSQQSSLKFNTLFFWVYADKPVLDKRLDTRVDSMLKTGGMQEIKDLYSHYKTLTPLPDCERGVWQVIGFKEFLPWLTSSEPTDSQLHSSVESMKARTRQYAKKQIKWIKGSLAVDLQRESKFGYPNGGRLYVLNATDLEQWQSNVFERGSEITEEFLDDKSTIPQAPLGLEELLPSTEDVKADKESEWKHIECDICRNSDDSKLILIGEQQYKIHLSSKRHRSNLNRGKRKREPLYFVINPSRLTSVSNNPPPLMQPPGQAITSTKSQAVGLATTTASSGGCSVFSVDLPAMPLLLLLLAIPDPTLTFPEGFNFLTRF
ncbi:hypothetical protein WICPIJ_001291 [Wickerhamomyces pijperi]|uniref:tRNA dimethylallyltransferase n=1 Tax=Wickerhamomyces pijperi TaxID=599730 RepID=A0A9P8TQV7_WICPI|nr:hypothetical protein WICPIJ_001291 [Wickerhamomyces pijperi]